eukprot:1076319-Heterocapsa_arctica.AAC.1
MSMIVKPTTQALRLPHLVPELCALGLSLAPLWVVGWEKQCCSKHSTFSCIGTERREYPQPRVVNEADAASSAATSLGA